MRILTMFFVALVLLFSNLNAEAFTKMASKKPEIVQKGKAKMWCPVCGMSLKGFYKTSHTAKTKDGKPVQYCSIRCLVNDHQMRDTDIKDAKVVDVISEKLIPVKDAYYVVGSKVPGTMSKVSKLAFSSKKAAQDFIKKMGGKIMRFDEVYKLAEASLKKDIAMTNKKRAKMMYPMGKRLYNAKCDKSKINPHDYRRINELKPVIKQNCKNLKEKQAQAVALYLWDKLRFEGKNALYKVKVSKDEKCPVCGMFVYKYPRWAAQLTFDGGHHSFDGVKDLAKYLLNPAKYGGKADFKAKKVIVTDYYTQLGIDGRKAFYVIGSDVLGPMGHELIPFEKKSDALTFKKDHKGTKIVALSDVTSSMLCELDGTVCE